MNVDTRISVHEEVCVRKELLSQENSPSSLSRATITAKQREFVAVFHEIRTAAPYYRLP
jgi:hypothetical protein